MSNIVAKYGAPMPRSRSIPSGYIEVRHGPIWELAHVSKKYNTRYGMRMFVEGVNRVWSDRLYLSDVTKWRSSNYRPEKVTYKHGVTPSRVSTSLKPEDIKPFSLSDYREIVGEDPLLEKPLVQSPTEKPPMSNITTGNAVVIGNSEEHEPPPNLGLHLPLPDLPEHFEPEPSKQSEPFEKPDVKSPPFGVRRRLPDTRDSITKKLVLKHLKHVPREDGGCERLVKEISEAGDKVWSNRASEALSQLQKDSFYDLKIYIQVGFYPDGRPGEVFLKGDRIGTKISGLLDALSMCLSIGLQTGVPLSWYVEKLRHMRFEPYPTGTSDPQIARATSLVDAIAQYLERFCEKKE